MVSSSVEQPTEGGNNSEGGEFVATEFVQRRSGSKMDNGRRLKNEKLAAYRQQLSNSTAYAGHLSSLVFGKIKSLWSAQASTFELGLNQFAGRIFLLL